MPTTSVSRRPLLRLVFPMILAGCIAGPPPSGGAPDAAAEGGAPPRAEVRSLLVKDALGRAWPAEAAPRRPELVLDAVGLVPGEEPAIFLFDDVDEVELAKDLARAPLLVAHEARRVDVDIDVRERAIVLVPTTPLALGRTYRVGVAAWAEGADGAPLGVPFVGTFTVASAEAGAMVTDAWPADGTFDVPPSIALLAVRFDDAITNPEGVTLLDAEGMTIRADVAIAPCTEIGWADGACVRLLRDADLAPDAEHHLHVDASVRDRAGAPVGPFETTFRTGGASESAIVRTAPPCAIDELPAEDGCLFADDVSASWRTLVDRPVRAFVEAGAFRAGAIAPRGDVVLDLGGLPAGVTLAGEVLFVDFAGFEVRVPLSLATKAPLAPITITETRADPAGPEPAQEYVEIFNYGDVPVDLAGFALGDAPDRVGDVVPAPASLAPGEAALLVADGFDAAHPEDPPVPPGVTLIRLGSSLANAGLANAGEPLYLRDAAGNRLSSVPALPSPGEARCIVRVGASPRAGDLASFAAGPCSPGRAALAPVAP